MTKAEQETTIRWDQEDHIADLYTAHPAQARRWAKQGYPIEVADRDEAGTPCAWRARVPKDAVRFRRVQDGKVVKRRTGVGRQFRAIDRASERRTATGATSASPGGHSMLNRAIDCGSGEHEPCEGSRRGLRDGLVEQEDELAGGSGV